MLHTILDHSRTKFTKPLSPLLPEISISEALKSHAASINARNGRKAVEKHS